MGDDHLWWTRRDSFFSQCMFAPWKWADQRDHREATGPNSTAEFFKSQIILWPLLRAVIYVNQDNGKWKQINSVFQSWCSLGIGNNVSPSGRKTKGQEYGFLWVCWWRPQTAPAWQWGDSPGTLGAVNHSLNIRVSYIDIMYAHLFIHATHWG